jgi:hypothetical protein
MLNLVEKKKKSIYTLTLCLDGRSWKKLKEKANLGIWINFYKEEGKKDEEWRQ